MRIRFFGSGPIYDETRAICERREHVIVEMRPASRGDHPSVLPRHRDGDAGPIGTQAAVPVPAGSSPSKLSYETPVPLGARLCDELLAQPERGERPSTVPDESRASFALRPLPKPEPAG